MVPQRPSQLRDRWDEIGCTTLSCLAYYSIQKSKNSMSTYCPTKLVFPWKTADIEARNWFEHDMWMYTERTGVQGAVYIQQARSTDWPVRPWKVYTRHGRYKKHFFVQFCAWTWVVWAYAVLVTIWYEGAGGGFFLACKDFGRMFDHSFTACAFYFFEVEISSRTLIRLFIPGSAHSGSANWDNCGRMFPDKLRVSSYPDAWTAA